MFMTTACNTHDRRSEPFILGLALLLFAGVGVAQATVCRVTSNANGGTGAAWDSPMKLQTALGDPNCGEIWVAKGVYTPSASADRTASFTIQRNVALYGGFSGSETLRSQRDPAANPTILSADLDADDNNTDGNHIDETRADIHGDNSYHVVWIDGTTNAGNIDSSTVLDGFTITGGYANGSSLPDSGGGGLYCDGAGSGHSCNPTIRHVTFSGNTAGEGATAAYGGAMFNAGQNGGTSSPMLRNVTFSGNSAHISNQSAFAMVYGGAMYNDGANNGTASPTLRSVTFSSNSASADGGSVESGAGGGAMANDASSTGTSSPILGNVTFSGNRTDTRPSSGTGTSYGGAIYNAADGGGTSSPILSNVTFSGNSATGNENSLGAGGAMFNTTDADSTSNPALSNVIAWGDSASSGDPEISNNSAGAVPIIDHSVIQGSGGSGSGWVAGMGSDQGGNLATNPQLGPLADHGGFTQTRLPGIGGSGIDAGSSTTCYFAPVNGIDQRGVSRLQDAQCDIGAVELAPAVAVTAMSGSGQAVAVWASFFNPLLVQVHDAAGFAVANVAVHASPAVAGQAGAACSTARTDDTGFAAMYCRANGKQGGPYTVTVTADEIPTSAPAIFLLTNTPGDGDLIFRDGFDPPGPRTSIMAAGDAPVDFALTMPGNLPDGVSMPLRALTDTQHQRLALVEVHKQGGTMWLRVTRYRDHGRHIIHGEWWPASAHPQLHMDVSASGTQAYVH